MTTTHKIPPLCWYISNLLTKMGRVAMLALATDRCRSAATMPVTRTATPQMAVRNRGADMYTAAEAGETPTVISMLCKLAGARAMKRRMRGTRRTGWEGAASWGSSTRCRLR